MDATEQDIAMANKAAMAAAMGGAAMEGGQEAPRRERGERGGERGRRNDRRGEPREDRQDFANAAPTEPTTGMDVNAAAVTVMAAKGVSAAKLATVKKNKLKQALKTLF